jgi:molybdenum cofactor cytidylyltransferase
MTVAALLLAAGRSSRFGTADKLLASLAGLPLATHAVRTLREVPVGKRFIVMGERRFECPGFEIVTNPEPEAGLSHSLSLGVAAAESAGAHAVLIALADMPFVSKEHFARVLACHRAPDSRGASYNGARTMPPALFGADWFEKLKALTGDRGAHDLLAGSEIVNADPDELVDIDRVDDLEVARRRLASLSR